METQNEVITPERVEGEVVQEASTEEVAKMEFRLINPTETGFLQKIEWNKTELETAVRNKITSYQNVVYTEDNMKKAKQDRAELNKLVKAIDERRKKVKLIILEPYDTFEDEIKEVLELINQPVSLIDKQIKDYEEKQKEEKKQQIMDAYNESIGEHKKVLPFESVFDSRFLNATYALSNAIQEVKDKIKKVDTDLQTIEGLDSKFKLNVRDVYIQTLDLSKAMAEDRRLKDMEARLEEERKAKEEAEAQRIAQEEAKRVAQEQEIQKKASESHSFSWPSQSEPKKNIQEVNRSESQPENNIFHGSDNKNQENAPENTHEADIAPESANEKKYKASFWCTGTREQINAVLEFMRNNNIKYGRVDK